MAVFHTINTEDGQEKLTLNLGALMELSRRDKALTDRYFELYKKMGSKNPEFNELEMGEFLYIAYRCARVREEDHMELEEFLYKLTDDRQEMANVFRNLFGAVKKKQGSPTRSGKPHAR